jgi:hypothetical protein
LGEHAGARRQGRGDRGGEQTLGMANHRTPPGRIDSS